MKTMNQIMIEHFKSEIEKQLELLKEENAKEFRDGHKLAAYSGIIRQCEMILKKLNKKESAK